MFWTEENTYSTVLRSAIISGLEDCALVGKKVPVAIRGKHYFGEVLNIGKSNYLFN